MKKTKAAIMTEHQELPVTPGTMPPAKKPGLNQVFLDEMVNRHEKVLCFRMDIHLPEECQFDEPDDRLIDFMNYYTKSLSIEGLEHACVVTIKNGELKNSHLHCAVLVDGNQAPPSTQLIKLAEDALDQTLVYFVPPSSGLAEWPNGGLVDYCTRDKDGNPQENGIMIDRNSELFNEQYNQVHQQISCLAEEKNDVTHRNIYYSRH